MESEIFDIEFMHEGRQYRGWVNPSDKLNDEGKPVSFHVVLNDVSFGYLSYSNGAWKVSETRPSQLVELAGAEIEKYYSRQESARGEELSQ